jgi:hypothetical protein
MINHSFMSNHASMSNYCSQVIVILTVQSNCIKMTEGLRLNNLDYLGSKVVDYLVTTKIIDLEYNSRLFMKCY